MCDSRNNTNIYDRQTHSAYCCFDCGKCPIYIATVTDDDELREQLAARYSTPGNVMSKDAINCLGCKAEKRYQHPFCEACEIRTCAKAHGASRNCGDCSEYPCALIEQRIPADSESRQCMYELHCR